MADELRPPEEGLTTLVWRRRNPVEPGESGSFDVKGRSKEGTLGDLTMQGPGRSSTYGKADPWLVNKETPLGRRPEALEKAPEPERLRRNGATLLEAASMSNSGHHECVVERSGRLRRAVERPDATSGT